MTTMYIPLIYQIHCTLLYNSKQGLQNTTPALASVVGTREAKQGALFGTQSLALFRTLYCLPDTLPLSSE